MVLWSGLQSEVDQRPTLSADWWHIDSNAGGFVDPQFIVDHESEFPGFVIRDETGAIKRVLDRALNISAIVEGLDYEAIHILTLGSLVTAILAGLPYLQTDLPFRFEFQAQPNSRRFGPRVSLFGRHVYRLAAT
jgi:hypothetical protein